MDIEILKIASDTKNHKVLDKCTHKAKQKNSMCGDEMEVSVKVGKDQILDFGYQSKSCIFCQASASVLSNFSINNKISNIDKAINFFETFFQNDETKIPKEFKKFKVLFHKSNLSRKECILLPFKALNKALKS